MMIRMLFLYSNSRIFHTILFASSFFFREGGRDPRPLHQIDAHNQIYSIIYKSGETNTTINLPKATKLFLQD